VSTGTSPGLLRPTAGAGGGAGVLATPVALESIAVMRPIFSPALSVNHMCSSPAGPGVIAWAC